MTKEQLLDKKIFYSDKLAELETADYPEEIEVKVIEYRAQLQAEYDANKKDDIQKTKHYIELLDMLISEQSDVDITNA